MTTSEPSAEPSLHAEERVESSLGFCEICREKKENEQLIKNRNCGHPFCLDCISKCAEENIKLGLKIIACPGLNCEYVLQLESFKHLISKDVLSLWEKAPSLELVPNSTYRGNEETKSAYSYYKDTPPILDDTTPMEPGLDRQQSAGSSQWKVSGEIQEKVANDVEKFGTSFCDDATATDDDSDSDAWPDTDDYDSEASPRSPKSCKKSKWFEKFLKGLEYMSTEEINDPARQWHCPACQGAAGAIKRYLSLKTLVKHAKTKGSRRVRLHRELAQLLEEKLLGSQVSSAALGGEACGNWKGLKEEKKHQEIVWPPMVVITNTIHKKDENNKWTGMTTQQLLDLFSSYDTIVKAQHFYNSNGHCGMSILIFESSARGYLEADWLHRHFAEEEAGRNAWNNRPVYFLPSGERQLYGYMAVKEDVDTFNQYSLKGKPKLKYEMRSYKEMVVNGIRQMSQDNLQLPWLQNRIAEQQSHAKDLEEYNDMLKEKLNNATKDMEILRLKAKQQHELDLEEMQFLERFYKDQINSILEARKGKDGDFEYTQQKEMQENAEQSSSNPSNTNDNIKNPKKEKRQMTESSDSEQIIQENLNVAPIACKGTIFKTVMGMRPRTEPTPRGEKGLGYPEKGRAERQESFRRKATMADPGETIPSEATYGHMVHICLIMISGNWFTSHPSKKGDHSSHS